MPSIPAPRTIRAGIIGTGAIAGAHALAIERSGLGRLVGVVDRDPAAAAAFVARVAPESDQTGAPAPTVHADLDGMLAAGLDVLHVCTPPGVHVEQAVAALEAGVHVVVEKPPALSLDELDRMSAAARSADRQLAVVFQQRTGTAAAHVRDLLRSGALGRPLIATCHTLWFRDPAYFAVPWRGSWATEGGGPTLGHGIHQIDLLAWLVGDWQSVTAQLWRLDRETGTEDSSTAVVTFEGGLIASIVTSAVSPRETSAIRIDTERATITVEHLYGHGHEHWSITPAPHVSAEEAAGWALPDVEERSGHDPLVRDVYAALIAGDPLPSTASDPARSFELVTAVYASAEHGRAITAEELRADARFRAGLASTVVDRRPGR
jgi:predicted dehydrogenase